VSQDESTSENAPVLCATVLDATDARAVAEFYRRLLGYVYRAGDEMPAPGQPDPQGKDWLVLRDQSGHVRLAFQHVDNNTAPTWPEPHVPQQAHLDLAVDSLEELAVQHRRAIDLGATLLEDRSQSSEEAINVYADPAGHPFCILVITNIGAIAAEPQQANL